MNSIGKFIWNYFALNGPMFLMFCSFFWEPFSGPEKAPKKCPPTVGGHFFGSFSGPETGPQIRTQTQPHNGAKFSAATRIEHSNPYA